MRSVFVKTGLIVLLFCSAALTAAPKGGRRGSRKDSDFDKTPSRRETSGSRAVLTCPQCNKRFFISLASEQGGRGDDRGGGHGPERGPGRTSGRDGQTPSRPMDRDGERGGGFGRSRTELTCPNCHKNLVIRAIPDRGDRGDGRGGPRGSARRN
ncbi:MAG: hypothetical protein IJU70_01715 [Lentisphaeria bacterium]|nr:hypothetical protein [Lentisphaeria bacterium]